MDTAFWKRTEDPCAGSHLQSDTTRPQDACRKRYSDRHHAYAVFEDTKPAADNVFSFLPAETMVMYQKENNALVMSVCTPNLNIAEKTFTTKEPSRIIIKELELKGKWHVSAYDKRVKTTYRTGTTQLSVECQHGQPVEFTLIQ